MEQLKPRIEPLGRGVQAYVTSAHGFGADAVLLARFAAPKPGWRLADLCSGCGIVPLLWCRDDPSCTADAFELLPEASALAQRSAKKNGFTGLRVFTQDICTLPANFAGCYALVTCNPPYRVVGAGRTSEIPAREIARGEVACTLEDVVRVAARLLAGKGRFCLCHRPTRLAELFGLLRNARLEPKRLRLVQQREDAPPWLALVEARKEARPGLEVEPVLCCERHGTFSAEWQEIYQDFCP
ncbi:MAG: methyltransferase [Ethanoligenens sp.]